MKFKTILLVCVSVATTSAWADGTATKSDLPVTILEKNMSSQLILDMSTAEGKNDLLRPVDGEVFIHPTSAGPFEMVPDTIAAAGIGECAASSLTPAEVQALVIKASQEEGFDQRLALAVAGQESGFNANAISNNGALGAMQLMPGTAADLKVNRCDPADNARGGVRYLKALMTQFGNPVFALAAYNAGPDKVLKHKGIPPFPETVQYVARVLNRYYGAPEPQRDTAVVAALVPDARPTKPRSPTKILPVSGAPDAQLWASGFVMHLN
jgi:hypothetical protein